ncbi:MAG: apolipoprotein N-acyltransferase [Planctomycetota bacterium]
MRIDKTIKSLIPWFGFAASAVLLTVIQPPISWSVLAYIAVVPFVLVCSPQAKPKTLFFSAYIISLIFWLGNLYWIAPVTIAGWLAFCIYTALLWPILALALQSCRKGGIPLFIAVPILFVGAERLQGFFLGGFFWRFLAHSQYQNTTLIQIADIFGAAGVSFIIAMLSGLIADLVITAAKGRVRSIAHLFFKTVTVCAIMLAAVFYGRYRISQAEETVTVGPFVASVQSNVPQSVKRTFQNKQDIFDDLIKDSNQAIAAGAELVIWPETMVQSILNTPLWPFLDNPNSAKQFDASLREHARNNASVLVGAYGGTIKRLNDGTSYLGNYNSAFLYNSDGSQAPESYNKIHLVPFGEVIPFKYSAPWIFDILMKFSPYNFDYSLEYGTEYTIFKMKSKLPPLETYNFAVMICYEDTVPGISSRFALDDNNNKRIHWLVNISNDGWFVRFKDKKVKASTELPQHAAVCVFRAVENRLSVVRCVNTGISCLIDSLGRVKNGYVSGNLPKNAMARKGVSGWFIDNVPIDNRITFFSRYGQWLDTGCAVCFGLMAFISLIPQRKKRSKKGRMQLLGKPK